MKTVTPFNLAEIVTENQPAGLFSRTLDCISDFLRSSIMLYFSLHITTSSSF